MVDDITHAAALTALKQPGVFDSLRGKVAEAVDVGEVVRPPSSYVGGSGCEVTSRKEI